ncbi:MAG TPA: hypothetical protein VGM54_24460 [Chthoniobacter sp.]
MTENLGHFIRRILKNRPTVRVFSDVLNRCWDLPKVEQEAAIRDFAQRHDWTVTVHEPFDIGVVAEFSNGHASVEGEKGLEARLK